MAWRDLDEQEKATIREEAIIILCAALCVLAAWCFFGWTV